MATGVDLLKRWSKSSQNLMGLTRFSCDTFKFCLSYISHKKVNVIYMMS